MWISPVPGFQVNRADFGGLALSSKRLRSAQNYIDDGSLPKYWNAGHWFGCGEVLAVSQNLQEPQVRNGSPEFSFIRSEYSAIGLLYTCIQPYNIGVLTLVNSKVRWHQLHLTLKAGN